VRLLPPRISFQKQIVSKADRPIATIGLILLTLTALLVPRAYPAVHPVPLEKNVDAAKCLECHNSDDNREFGGTGPSGPHGSQFSHILERRFEFSQVAPGLPPAAGPGSAIQNLLPAILDPAANGPYSLCAKCHNLSTVAANTSFTKHSVHINAGFSCSVCHTAHGMGASSSNVSVERLVNFDLRVVAATASAPIFYNRGSNTCTLRCHNYNHNADGAVTPAVNLKNAAPSKH
jgi:hypothetical protein